MTKSTDTPHRIHIPHSCEPVLGSLNQRCHCHPGCGCGIIDSGCGTVNQAADSGCGCGDVALENGAAPMGFFQNLLVKNDKNSGFRGIFLSHLASFCVILRHFTSFYVILWQFWGNFVPF
jgi:hypothetical protein